MGDDKNPVGKAEVHNHNPDEPIALGIETHNKHPGIDKSWENAKESKSEEK